jgi:hypothetical protein
MRFFAYGNSLEEPISSYDKINIGLKVAEMIKYIPDSLELFREHHFALASYILDISHKYHFFSYSVGENPQFSLLEEKQREIEDIIQSDGRADQLWFDVL